jgi:hypothetical protein
METYMQKTYTAVIKRSQNSSILGLLQDRPGD